MTEEEIENILHLSAKELYDFSQGDFEFFCEALSIAVNTGIRIGQRDRDKQYLEMFRGYNEVSVWN